MPRFDKKTLSLFLRTGCQRQLRLHLSPDVAAYRHERQAQGMPPEMDPRPGLEHAAQAGEEWERSKREELREVLGADALMGTEEPDQHGQLRFTATPLEQLLKDAKPSRFFVEAEFDVGPTFRQSIGLEAAAASYPELGSLNFSDVRPDLIEVAEMQERERLARPEGSVELAASNDNRLLLRVIDVKLTSEPGANYFGEVVYYTLALAAWLLDHQLDQDFAVSANPALWPGSHEASEIIRVREEFRKRGVTPTQDDLLSALSLDLLPAEFEVFALRLRQLFTRDLPAVFAVEDWRDLDWHVDNRCRGCEYLGYAWGPRQQEQVCDDHCLPMAHRLDHLSRLAFFGRGARLSLAENLTTVQDLALLHPDHPHFDRHQLLRAGRYLFRSRAEVLQTGDAVVPEGTGAAAAMPRWPHLRVLLSADFDSSSAITFAFGLKGVLAHPDYQNVPEDQRWRFFPERGIHFYPVDTRSLDAERREFLALLEQIRRMLDDAQRLYPQATVQFYVWDELTLQHLCRVTGRHLAAILANNQLRDLVWLFPSEEVVPNARLAKAMSPTTVVKEVVRAVLAAPVPHYYSLLDVARSYHPEGSPEAVARFHVHPLFHDPLSDQIPPERAQEIWSRINRPNLHWQRQMQILGETVATRLDALGKVLRRLQTDLRDRMTGEAPQARHLTPPQPESRLSTDGQLWFAFARLDAAVEQMEVNQIRAMPPHEREARFHSARLMRRLTGAEETEALTTLSLQPQGGRRVYEMRTGSREVKLKAGDFNCALAPETWPDILNLSFRRLCGDHDPDNTPEWIAAERGWRQAVDHILGMRVAGIDRDRRLIALDALDAWPTVLEDLEAHNIIGPDGQPLRFDEELILDPVYRDFFTKNLLKALKAIGNPPIAADEPLVRDALGLRNRRSRATDQTPAADVLWQAGRLSSEQVDVEIEPLRQLLTDNDLGLNPRQWEAWEAALTRRLQLIWGPPGTGKSRTARAVVVAAAVAAAAQNRPLRILVTAFTYRAIENVFQSTAQNLQTLCPDAICLRVRSPQHVSDGDFPEGLDVEFNADDPDMVDLIDRLRHSDGITVLGATARQTQKLLELAFDKDRPIGPLFDFILIDEASQLGVAHAILPLCGLAEGGQVILAGDDRQLPPIHKAEPPVNLEPLVGSIYGFFRHRHDVPHIMLNVNYRSNETIVGLVRQAGYEADLHAHSPDLRLRLSEPLPTEHPADWPEALFWTPAWQTLLDPACPIVCFVYDEGRSSQWNRFEADAIAALTWLLHGRMCDHLDGERNPSGELILADQVPYSEEGFWDRGLGIVTPHRAQQGLVVSRLTRIFDGVEPSRIRSAVDTVERFQGQQRDVMLVTFALGDPDAIREEEEFLLSLNRFNVVASRARAKVVVLLTRQIVDYLSEEPEVLQASRLLKVFADSYCQNRQPMTLGYQDDEGIVLEVPGVFRSR